MESSAPTFTLPVGYGGIKVVASFEELVSTRFGGRVNALCWPRVLPGDYGEVVARLEVGPGITAVEDERLRGLALSAAGTIARDQVREDLELLRGRELAPCVECVHGYVQEVEEGPVRTDVQSFHADSATVEADTYLCTYYGPASEGLRNEEARRRVDVPETRAELLRLYGGADDEGFVEFLSDHFFDLHYAPLPRARPFSFGVGNLWRVAIAYPGCAVPPCIHRAPATVPGAPPRLLLMS